MNAKTTLVLIAILGIGLFALPQTTALFAGQHTFVNIDATGNQIDCVKCHGDVNAELTLSAADAPHKNFKCEFCHRVEPGKASGDSIIYSLAYTDGVNNRTLVMSATDFEAGRFPATIPASGKLTIPNSLAFAVSQDTAGPSTTMLPPILSHGSPAQASPIELLNADGTPKDTNTATKFTGVRLSAVINTTQWDYTKANPAILLNGLGSEVVNPGTTYHSASLVSCMECHGGEAPPGHETATLSTDCSICHYGGGTKGGQQMRNLWAGGFGLTTKTNDTGSVEAHKSFQTTNDTLTRQKDGVSNGACVACHTHVAVDITYTKPTTYRFNAVFNSNGSKTLDGFAAAGQTTTYSSGATSTYTP